METILNLLPVLAIAIVMNTATGIYYNVGTNKMQFDLKILVSGVIKACIVGFCFIGTAYCFEMTDLNSIGVSPDLIMNAAITLYVGKTISSLMKILGVEMGSEKNNKDME